MTREEQIKQNAEKYAKYFDTSGEITIYKIAKEGYIAGAHSRDEEINALHDLLDTYERELDQLRNPWISVEERLPRDEDYDDENIYCFLVRQECGFIYNCAFDGEEWLTAAPDGEEWGVCGVTHWMTIPKLKGGER